MIHNLGPPIHYIHVIWLAAGANDPQEYYDELDEGRWSIRGVRLYRGDKYECFSHDSPDWRDVMPEAAIDEPDVINRDTQFRARAISRQEFETAWDAAQPENPLRFNVVSQAGQFLCPCCGLDGQFSRAPYRATGGVIGAGICGCCLWQPGFDDDPAASGEALPSIKASLVAYRAKWMEEGYPSKAQHPASRRAAAEGDGQARCDQLLRSFPHLA